MIRERMEECNQSWLELKPEPDQEPTEEQEPKTNSLKRGALEGEGRQDGGGWTLNQTRLTESITQHV